MTNEAQKRFVVCEGISDHHLRCRSEMELSHNGTAHPIRTAKLPLDWYEMRAEQASSRPAKLWIPEET